MAKKQRPKPIDMREVVGTAIRVSRVRAGLDHSRLARRVTALGLNWKRQTVGMVESGARRVGADELLPLSLALECSMADLIAPSDPVHRGVPILIVPDSDRYLPASEVGGSAGLGRASLVVGWQGDTPIFTPKAVIDRLVDDVSRVQVDTRRSLRQAAPPDVLDVDSMAKHFDAFMDRLAEQFPEIAAQAGVPAEAAGQVRKELTKERLREIRAGAFLEAFGEEGGKA